MKFRFGEDRKKRMVTFSSLVPELMEDLDIKESFFISQLKEKWPFYVGKILSTHSFPDRIFNKILFINVDHSAYAGELSIHAADIQKQIQNDFGENLIKSVKFEIKKSRWRNT